MGGQDIEQAMGVGGGRISSRGGRWGGQDIEQAMGVGGGQDIEQGG